MTFMAKVVPSCALWALQQIVGWWVESITINLISHQVFQARGRFRISTASAEIALGCDGQRLGQPRSFSFFSGVKWVVASNFLHVLQFWTGLSNYYLT